MFLKVTFHLTAGLVFAGILSVPAVATDLAEYAGGYRFKYYAVTHEGAEEEFGGAGVIYISPESFGFGTNPELENSSLVKELVNDRTNEYILNRDKADVCMANLPAPGSTAAIALMSHQLVLSRAGKSEGRIQFDYIRSVDSAFDWVLHFDRDNIVGTGWNHERWFAFASDRMELTPAPEIGLAECVAFAVKSAEEFNDVRDASEHLWNKHRARVEENEFWAAYEKRTSAGLELALKRTDAELDWKPEKGMFWAMRALIYGNAVDFMGVAPAAARTNAESSLEKAEQFAPESNITRAAYGLVLRDHDPAGAEQKLKRCIERNPSFPECHNLYGDLLRKTGRAEQAGEIYLQGLERWPDNGELHVSYALYLQETGRAEEAIEYLRKFVANQPGFPRGRWHLAVMLYEEGGDMGEARDHAVKALEMDPKIWNGEKLLLELLKSDRLR